MKTSRGFFTRIRPILPRDQGLESLSGLARIFLVATVQGANRRGGGELLEVVTIYGQESRCHIWVFPKNRGYPKMDGENNGKPY